MLIETQNLNFMSEDGTYEKTEMPINKFGMQTVFLYSEPSHPFVKYCIDKIYDNGQRAFILSDGSYESFIIDGALIWALKNFSGLKFKDKT